MNLGHLPIRSKQNVDSMLGYVDRQISDGRDFLLAPLPPRRFEGLFEVPNRDCDTFGWLL